MWLIKTDTLKLKNVINPEPGSCAILSHTWREEEISFQDFRDTDKAKAMMDFGKIKKTCELALDRDIPYAWIDTCCIDKTSSAELSEAINSMFTWYHNAAVCFVYLSDLGPSSEPTVVALRRCRWFSRGWTLQELIAPTNVQFYNSHWQPVATKTEIPKELMEVTGINELAIIFRDRGTDVREVLRSLPVSIKMSWAASRVTTRPEDMAYCLLGLFDINMPILYGEGERAFIRLQEAICGQTNDLSLFAWTAAPAASSVPSTPYRRILAHHPREFGEQPNKLSPERHSFNLSVWGFDFQHCDFTITNRGLQMDNARLLHAPHNRIFIDLGLPVHGTNGDVTSDASIKRVGIFVEWTPEGYFRVKPDRMAVLTRKELGMRIRAHRIYVHTIGRAPGSTFNSYSAVIDGAYSRLYFAIDKRCYAEILDAAPASAWSYNKTAFIFPLAAEEFAGVLHLKLRVESWIGQAVLIFYKTLSTTHWRYHIIIEGSSEWNHWVQAEYGLENLFRSRIFRDYMETVKRAMSTAPEGYEARATFGVNRLRAILKTSESTHRLSESILTYDYRG
ncbi:HET domain-containing protein [Seiridium cupressi]